MIGAERSGALPSFQLLKFLLLFPNVCEILNSLNIEKWLSAFPLLTLTYKLYIQLELTKSQATWGGQHWLSTWLDWKLPQRLVKQTLGVSVRSFQRGLTKGRRSTVDSTIIQAWGIGEIWGKEGGGSSMSTGVLSLPLPGCLVATCHPPPWCSALPQAQSHKAKQPRVETSEGMNFWNSEPN